MSTIAGNIFLPPHKIIFYFSRTGAAERLGSRIGGRAALCDAGSSGVPGLESAEDSPVLCTGPGAAGAGGCAEPGAVGAKRKQAVGLENEAT